MPPVQAVTDLPFVAVENHRVVNFWACEESGAYMLDCKIGRGHADHILALMRHQHRPELLGRVMQDMVKGGRYGGIEAGFSSRLAQRAIAPEDSSCAD